MCVSIYLSIIASLDGTSNSHDMPFVDLCELGLFAIEGNHSLILSNLRVHTIDLFGR